MYPNPGQNGQWNPNGPPAQQQTQWSPNPASQAPNGVYPPRPNPNQIPPISQALNQGPIMTTLQPQHPDQYRALPAPPHMYYAQQPPMPYPAQPAPRQRTAIACRYCRRRKIRCSGFDQSEDGRCTNCQRFSQGCVFTPVSAQTQAFVPAHTVWRGQQPPPGQQLYGAYGQPLPPNSNPYPPPQHQQGQPGQYPPTYGPPQGYQQPGQPPQYVQSPLQHQQQQAPPLPNQQQPVQPQMQIQASPPEAGRKRTADEPLSPTLPPPNPAPNSNIAQHRASTGDPSQQHFTYPDPTGLTPAAASPASSTASFHSAQPPQQQPYYTQPQQPGRRASPQSTYSYDASRASSSPNLLGQTGTPAPTSNAAFDPHVSMGERRTPPPTSAAQAAQRQGVKINDLVGPAGQQAQQNGQANGNNAKQEDGQLRSAADEGMLKKLASV